MNIKDAKEIATKFINQNLQDFDHEDEFIIIDDVTIEKEYGWIFSYNSKKYIETDDFSYCIVGNGPIVVNKESGLVEELGGGPQVENFIAEYEARIMKNNLN
jgi:hypothetical protein